MKAKTVPHLGKIAVTYTGEVGVILTFTKAGQLALITENNPALISDSCIVEVFESSEIIRDKVKRIHQDRDYDKGVAELSNMLLEDSKFAECRKVAKSYKEDPRKNHWRAMPFLSIMRYMTLQGHDRFEGMRMAEEIWQGIPEEDKKQAIGVAPRESLFRKYYEIYISENKSNQDLSLEELEGFKTYEIWAEGFAATGQRGGAHYWGESKGKDFQDACDRFALTDREFASYYDRTRMTHWGCKLYDNKETAIKSFG